jgi:hypothetical protein
MFIFFHYDSLGRSPFNPSVIYLNNRKATRPAAARPPTTSAVEDGEAAPGGTVGPVGGAVVGPAAGPAVTLGGSNFGYSFGHDQYTISSEGK